MVTIVMQSAPQSIDPSSLYQNILSIKGVIGVHDIHVWQLDEQRIIATVHVVCRNRAKFKSISNQIQKLMHNHGVHATTIQPEYEAEGIEDDGNCRSACISPECAEYRCCK